MMDDFRYWLARKLLSLVNCIDPHTKIMVDAKERWKFQRGWLQPTSSQRGERPC